MDLRQKAVKHAGLFSGSWRLQASGFRLGMFSERTQGFFALEPDRASLDRRWRMKWQLCSDWFAPESLPCKEIPNRHSLTWLSDTQSFRQKQLITATLSLRCQSRSGLSCYHIKTTDSVSVLCKSDFFFPQSQNLNRRLVTKHKLGPSTRQHCSTSGIHTTAFFSGKLGISLSPFFYLGCK